MNLLRSGSRQNVRLGVALSGDGVSFALIRRRATQPPRVLHAEFLALEGSAPFAQVLGPRLGKLGLQKHPCNLVLNSDDYSLLLVEAPRVPAGELGEALRWRIKDLIDFPVADAAVDAFLLPEDSVRGNARMAYAAVTRRARVAAVVEQAREARLDLTSIDINELALRNLAQACCDTDRGLALVRLIQGGGSIQVLRKGNLYLARRLTLPYNGGLLDELPGNELILELQRSLDYVERQMHQPPPAHIVLCGDNISVDKLTDGIRAGVNAPLSVLNPGAGLELAQGVQEHTLSLCLPAIGAALRQEQGA